MFAFVLTALFFSTPVMVTEKMTCPLPSVQDKKEWTSCTVTSDCMISKDMCNFSFAHHKSYKTKVACHTEDMKQKNLFCLQMVEPPVSGVSCVASKCKVMFNGAGAFM